MQLATKNTKKTRKEARDSRATDETQIFTDEGATQKVAQESAVHWVPTFGFGGGRPIYGY
jgi:hypothetical protein